MQTRSKRWLPAVVVVCVGIASGIPGRGNASITGRDTRFLTLDEVGNQQTVATTQVQKGDTAVASQSGRDTMFRLPGEVTAAPATGQGNRDQRFRTPGDTPDTTGGQSTLTSQRAIGTATIGNCREWVNVRSDPSTGQSAIGKANLGDSVSVLSWSDGWAYVRWGQNLGWIAGQFIR